MSPFEISACGKAWAEAAGGAEAAWAKVGSRRVITNASNRKSLISGFLWSDDGTVSSAECPLPCVVVDGIFCRRLFIDIDAETGGLVHVHVSFLYLRRTGEDLFCLVVEEYGLLDAEVPDVKIYM